MLWNTVAQTVELGWDFLCAGHPFVALMRHGRASVGGDWILRHFDVAHVRRLCRSALWASRCSTGIDAFALTAIPLFILTGDVLVRTGLSRKFLDVAEALTCWTKGGFGSATVLVCGMFSAISGSDAAGAAAVGRMTIARLVESWLSAPLCLRAGGGGCLYRHSDPAVDCLHHHRPCAGHFRLDLVPRGADPGLCYPDLRFWSPTW